MKNKDWWLGQTPEQKAKRAKAKENLSAVKEQFSAETAQAKESLSNETAPMRAAMAEQREAAVERKARRAATKKGFGITVDGNTGTIKKGREVHPVEGVTATVESAGQIDRRMSATRVAGGAVLLGPLGAVLGGLAKRKVDPRQLFLLVEGPQFGWVVEIKVERGAGSQTLNKKNEKKAREMAVAINAAGRAPGRDNNE